MQNANQGWVQIDLDCAAEAADGLAAELADRLHAAVEVKECGVRLFFPVADWTPQREQEFNTVLASCPVSDPSEIPFTVSRIADQDWGVTWKEHFKPLRVGRNFMVVPSWETYAPLPGDRIIQIDPGQAFGTGHHETTRLCLEWLEDYAEGRDPDADLGRFLDVGTGSGILAIAAGLLGFREITAVDVDPDAIRVARENAARNLPALEIRWHNSDVSTVRDHYDVVMANIQALPLIAMAAALHQRLAPEGRLVLSGILVEQLGAVEAAYAALGLTLEARRQAGEWCLLAWGNGEKANRRTSNIEHRISK